MKFLLASLALHLAIAAAACSGTVEVRGMPKEIKLTAGSGCDAPADAGDED